MGDSQSLTPMEAEASIVLLAAAVHLTDDRHERSFPQGGLVVSLGRHVVHPNVAGLIYVHTESAERLLHCGCTSLECDVPSPLALPCVQ